MDPPQQCTSCGSTSARACSQCRSAVYCSLECQQTDWRTHRQLCSAFKQLSPPSFPVRPSPSHYLVVYFPAVNRSCKPQLQWVDTKEVAPGFQGPILDQLLHVPDQTGYIGRGLQIVRGNILRGRPKFLDSLNVVYLDDFGTEDLPVNGTLHGWNGTCIDGWGEKMWHGPVVAYLKVGNDWDAKKMTDMTLTAYRDAIDYLAYFRDTIGSMIDWPGSNAKLSKMVMAQRSGKVKGVRINCVGDMAGDPTREFVSVDVPLAHPVFLEGDDPLEIMDKFGESWEVYRYAGYKDAKAREAQNSGRVLLLNMSEELLEGNNWGVVPEWRIRYTTGSLLVVRRTKDDIDIRKVKAACRLLKDLVLPKLAEGLDTQAGPDRMAIQRLLTLEKLQEFM